MSETGAYAPSPRSHTREQVEAIEAAGDTRVVDTQGRPVVMMTMRGRKTGAIRKVPVMRVEHDGSYLAVASMGGAPTHPEWYLNLVADPEITLQDGTESWPARARELEGEERYEWWVRAVDAFPPYADYQVRTQRQIPLLVLERR